MASQTWPATLPQGPTTFSEGNRDSILISTQTDSGPDKVRRRFTKPVVEGQMGFLLTLQQRKILKDFHEKNLNMGTERFNFFHPWDQVMREFRIVGQPKYAAEGPLAVSVTLSFQLY